MSIFIGDLVGDEMGEPFGLFDAGLAGELSSAWVERKGEVDVTCEHDPGQRKDGTMDPLADGKTHVDQVRLLDMKRKKQIRSSWL